MELLLHVTIALSSIAITTYACISPTLNKLRLSYSLIALTLITGTYLTVLNPGHLLQACMSGLIYVAVMTGATSLSRYRLAQTSPAEPDRS